MSTRIQKMFKKLKEDGVSVPDITEITKKNEKRRRRRDEKDDATSVCSSITASELGILNPMYLEELSGNVKCDAFVKGTPLQDVATPPKLQTYGLVSYTPSSTSTAMTHVSVDNEVFKISTAETSNENKGIRSPNMRNMNAPREIRVGLSNKARKRMDPALSLNANPVSTVENKENSFKMPVRRQLIPEAEKSDVSSKKRPSPNKADNLLEKKKFMYDDGVSDCLSNKKTRSITNDDSQTTAGHSKSKLSPYQIARLKNLKQNEEFLSDLGGTPSPPFSCFPHNIEGTSPKTPDMKPKRKGTSPKTLEIYKTNRHTATSSTSERDVPKRQARVMAEQMIQKSLTTKDKQLHTDDDGSEYNSDGDDDKDDEDDNEDERYSLSLSGDNGGSTSSEGEESEERTDRGGKRRLSQNLSTPTPKHSQNAREPHPEHTLSEEEVDDDFQINEQLRHEDDEELRDSGPNDTEGSPDQTDPKAPSGKGNKIRTKQKAKRKELRNLGQQYTTVKGKIINEKVRKPPHQCSVRRCHEIVTPEIGDQIFDDYWKQGSHNKRVAYLGACIETHEIERKRSRTDNEKRQKSQSHKYYIEIKGKRVQVCRSTLMDTLGESDRVMRNVTENKSQKISGITSDDKRGKHTPKHTLAVDKKEAVQRHIASFPAYVSHYCRSKTKDQRFLASDLTEAQMYRLYCSITPEDVRVSQSTYHNQFKLSGLKFHPPQMGCDKCDTYEISIKNSEGDQQKTFKMEKEVHLRKAEKAYHLKRAAKEAAKKDPSSRVLVVDLQQCLPTPHLRCKKIYYSRQLYVYNFTVHDCSTELTHCYMWSEVEGHRGSNEITTCLLHHLLEHVPETVKKVTIFSDCCSGQNRNNTMCMMMFIALQEHQSVEEINHIYLIPGHTFMPEVDGKHAIIEKYKRGLEKVNVPEEWYTHVEKAGKTDPKNYPEGKFKVTHLTQFFDVASLAKEELIKRNKCTDKEPFNYLETQWMKYEKQNIGLVQVKSSFNEDAEFRTLSFLRQGTRSDRVKQLRPCLKTLSAVTPISAKKKKDLLGLLCYLDQNHHDFYNNLPACNSAEDLHPLSRRLEENEDDVPSN